MRFTIRQEALVRPLQMIGGIIEKRQANPILSNILLRVSSQQLSITGTDLEIEMITHISINNSQPGAITLSARKMIDICRSLPADAEITIKGDENRAIIHCGRSRFTLSTLPSEQYPELDQLSAAAEFSISQRSLKQLIDNTMFSMAQQDVRYFLNGVCLELGGGHLRAIATDGHRLALCSIPHEQANITQEQQLIIPRKAVVELSRLLVDTEKPVSVQIGNNHIKFMLPSLVFTAKLIDGQFPAYQRVIPVDNTNELVIDRVQFFQALKRASILSNEKLRSVRLGLSRELLRIAAYNQEQEEAEEEIPAEYRGEEQEIGFNVSYLLDVLQIVPDQQVKMLLGDANSSCLINTTLEGAESSYVIMPVRL